MHACICVFTCMCVYNACMHTCMHACINMYACVCERVFLTLLVCVCVCVHTHEHVNMCSLSLAAIIAADVAQMSSRTRTVSAHENNAAEVAFEDERGGDDGGCAGREEWGGGERRMLFDIVSRGMQEIKGKGLMELYDAVPLDAERAGSRANSAVVAGGGGAFGGQVHGGGVMAEGMNEHARHAPHEQHGRPAGGSFGGQVHDGGVAAEGRNEHAQHAPHVQHEQHEQYEHRAHPGHFAQRAQSAEEGNTVEGSVRSMTVGGSGIMTLTTQRIEEWMAAPKHKICPWSLSFTSPALETEFKQQKV